MKDQLITFETAKLAKEKGFDGAVSRYYLHNGELHIKFEQSYGESDFYFDADDFHEDMNHKGLAINKEGDSSGFGCTIDNIKYFEPFSAPTQTTLQRWLLEKHNIKVSVDSGTLNMKKEWVDWYGSINQSIKIDHRDGADTKEKALDILLLEALKLVK